MLLATTSIRSRVIRSGQVTLALIASVATIAACSDLCEPATRGTGGHYGRSITGPGMGKFAFTLAGAKTMRGGQSLRVWYSAPDTNASTAQIVIVMHGAERDGESYLEDWGPLVRGRDVLLLVPEFPKKEYPGVESYNLANMLDSAGKLRRRDQWSFQVIEALFDHVVADVRSNAKGYAMFGHSAGAQYVHRFMEFAPRNRARIAVAANAGWYTLADNSAKFPYGLDDSPFRESDMGPALASNLVVLLGADDIDPEDDSLRRDDKSDAQGHNRLERGLNFYMTARHVAAQRSLPFKWRLNVVPGIGHSHADMAKAAAPLLLDAP